MAPCDDDTVSSVSDVAAEHAAAAPLTHFLTVVLPARDKEGGGGAWKMKFADKSWHVVKG